MHARSAMNPRPPFHGTMAEREILDLERETMAERISTLSTMIPCSECISTLALHDSMAAHFSMDLACESTVLRGFMGAPYASMIRGVVPRSHVPAFGGIF